MDWVSFQNVIETQGCRNVERHRRSNERYHIATADRNGERVFCKGEHGKALPRGIQKQVQAMRWFAERRAELAPLGVPALHAAGGGWFISTWVTGEALESLADDRKPEALRLLLEAIEKLRDLPVDDWTPEDPLNYAHAHAPKASRDISCAMELEKWLCQRTGLKAQDARLSHGDLGVRGNVLFDLARGLVWLIDWENVAARRDGHDLAKLYVDLEDARLRRLVLEKARSLEILRLDFEVCLVDQVLNKHEDGHIFCKLEPLLCKVVSGRWDWNSAPLTKEALRRRREEILEIAWRHGARDVRIFGSTARGNATELSDLDLLVRFEPGRSLMDHGMLIEHLQELLGIKVHVVSEGAMRVRFLNRVMRESVPL